jgi:aquaporin Z
VMVYMGGHVSGAHYNPAVTLAILLRKKIEAKDAAVYMVFQVVGAMLAAAVYYFLMGKTFAPAPAPEVGAAKPLLVEILFTFALASVVLNVATHSKTAGNSFYGLAIGFTVLAAAFAGGPISGGAYNPAVAVGPILMDAVLGEGTGLGQLWLYLVGPFIGGAAAAIVFKMVNPGE